MPTRWNSTDQVALRALTTGQIGLYGELDPTDGGDTSRFSLSGRVAQTTDNGSWKANAYVVKYTMDLWNNFTWDTNDPAYGDQFHQHDDRVYGGGGASRTFNGTLVGLPTETVFGVQTRYDNINIALNYTYQRQFLTPYYLDHVNEGNAAIYAENTVHWTNWLRTVVGWRGDYYAASVNSILQPANSGNVKEAIGSPKFRMVLGPFAQDRILCRRRHGLPQQRRARATVTQVPGDPTTPQGANAVHGAFATAPRSAFAPRPSRISTARSAFSTSTRIRNCSSTATRALPRLGCRASARASRSPTNIVLPRGFHIDADLALSRARFVGFDTTQEALYQSLAGYPQAQIGNAPGNYIYNAPWMVGVGRHYARRKDRLVQHAALALYQLAAAH